jgi:predicted nucleic acid-binding protein
MWAPRRGGIEAVSRLGDSDVFVDTSILVTLTRVSRLDLLWNTYPGRPTIPDPLLHLEVTGSNLRLPLGKRVTRKKTKPLWLDMAKRVTIAIESGYIKTAEPTDIEETLALTLAQKGMHYGEAIVYAMAFNRNAICCSSDMRALMKTCVSNRVPLLGIFGIVYDSLAENVIDDSEAESLLEAIVSSEEGSLPSVGLREVRDWFDRQTGRPLFD